MSVRTIGREIGTFPVIIDLHQVSLLRTYLFTLAMDELTRKVQDEVLWCLLFAEYIVSIYKTRIWISFKLEVWRQTLESIGFKIGSSKIEYMEMNLVKRGEKIVEQLISRQKKYSKKTLFIL